MTNCSPTTSVRLSRRKSAPLIGGVWPARNCEAPLRPRQRRCTMIPVPTLWRCDVGRAGFTTFTENEVAATRTTVEIPVIVKRTPTLEDHIRYLIPGKLAFVSLPADELSKLKHQCKDSLKFVSSKLHSSYCPLCADFGPVDLSIVYRFCGLIRKALDMEAKTGKPLLYCAEADTASRANTAFLLASFLMLDRGYSPEAAAALFHESALPFALSPFRDATYSAQDYSITILDCLCGLSKAVHLKWFDMTSFNLHLYEHLYDSANGDIHQLCPKLIAFKGPLAAGSRYLVDEEIALPPAHYASVLTRMGATAVVRLNEPDTYDAAEFEAAGIRHYDLYFNDCTVPPARVVDAFLDVCAREAVVAVHCRAGLGRTGTLAGLWMMAQHGFTANEAIAWLRIVRPGSVIGPQQHFLADAEAEYRATPLSSRTASDNGTMESLVDQQAAARALALQVQSALLKKSETSRARSAAAAAAAPHPRSWNDL